jgi:hypothetical protein
VAVETELMATCSFRSALASRLQAFWESHYARGQRGLSSHKSCSTWIAS